MRIILVIPTFYSDKDDIRYGLALESCEEIARNGLEAIMVDASPDESVRDAIVQHGTDSHGQPCVTVVPQTFKGKKGAALREGISLAVDRMQKDVGMIAFQEPEKVDMIAHWREVATILIEGADVCVAKRSETSFQTSYPIEQYHSETFANMYLDSLARKVNFPSVDWTMGPIAFKSSAAQPWLDYEGYLWDMQLVPLVMAQRLHGAKVASYEFDYQHPRSMKEEESGDPKWSEKRLFQLNFLFDKVGKVLTE